jgi:hypothetical protein
METIAREKFARAARLRAILSASDFMRTTSHSAIGNQAPVESIWRMGPRKFLRSLPTCTRPSLFGSD